MRSLKLLPCLTGLLLLCMGGSVSGDHPPGSFYPRASPSHDRKPSEPSSYASPPVTYGGPIVYSDEKPPIIHFPSPPRLPNYSSSTNERLSSGSQSVKYVPLPHHDLPVLIYQSEKQPPIHVVHPPAGKSPPRQPSSPNALRVPYGPQRKKEVYRDGPISQPAAGGLRHSEPNHHQQTQQRRRVTEGNNLKLGKSPPPNLEQNVYTKEKKKSISRPNARGGHGNGHNNGIKGFAEPSKAPSSGSGGSGGGSFRPSQKAVFIKAAPAPVPVYINPSSPVYASPTNNDDDEEEDALSEGASASSASPKDVGSSKALSNPFLNPGKTAYISEKPSGNKLLPSSSVGGHSKASYVPPVPVYKPKPTIKPAPKPVYNPPPSPHIIYAGHPPIHIYEQPSIQAHQQKPSPVYSPPSSSTTSTSTTTTTKAPPTTTKGVTPSTSLSTAESFHSEHSGKPSKLNYSGGGPPLEFRGPEKRRRVPPRTQPVSSGLPPSTNPSTSSEHQFQQQFRKVHHGKFHGSSSFRGSPTGVHHPPSGGGRKPINEPRVSSIPVGGNPLFQRGKAPGSDHQQQSHHSQHGSEAFGPPQGIPPHHGGSSNEGAGHHGGSSNNGRHLSSSSNKGHSASSSNPSSIHHGGSNPGVGGHHGGHQGSSNNQGHSSSNPSHHGGSNSGGHHVGHHSSSSSNSNPGHSSSNPSHHGASNNGGHHGGHHGSGSSHSGPSGHHIQGPQQRHEAHKGNGLLHSASGSKGHGKPGPRPSPGGPPRGHSGSKSVPLPPRGPSPRPPPRHRGHPKKPSAHPRIQQEGPTPSQGLSQQPLYIPAPKAFHKPPIIIYQGFVPPVHVFKEDLPGAVDQKSEGINV